MENGQRTSLRRSARTVAARLAGGLGYELVRKHYYSPIPDLAQLPTDTWTREAELPGVSFDPGGGLEYVRNELAPYLAEYQPPEQPLADPRRYHLNNGFYESLDAELLYAMVRRWSPNQIIELGSGMSTLVIGDARERNGQAPRDGYTVFDPYARPDLIPALGRVANLRAVSATDVPLDEFDALTAGDLLFVDTTHTVKIGGDVNRVILDVMPRLAPGVIVHVHDIYLPWEYPQEFFAERRFFWAEQYLLQAFLAFNDQFEVLFGAHALARLYPEEMAFLVPNMRYGKPSAFWLRRVER